MKLSESVIDLLIGVDPRSRGAGNGTADPSSGGGAATPFAGVLADVGSATGPTAASDPASGDKTAIAPDMIGIDQMGSGPTIKLARPQAPATQKQTNTDRSPDPKSSPTKTVEALIGNLFEVAAASRSDKVETRASVAAETMSIDDTRRRSKVTAPMSDLMAMLLMRTGLSTSPSAAPVAAEEAPGVKDESLPAVVGAAPGFTPPSTKETSPSVAPVAAEEALGVKDESLPAVIGAATVSTPSLPKETAPSVPGGIAGTVRGEAAVDVTPMARERQTLSDVVVSTHLAPRAPSSVASTDTEAPAAGVAGVVGSGLPAPSRRSADLKAMPKPKAPAASEPTSAALPSSSPDREAVTADPLRLSQTAADETAGTSDVRSLSVGRDSSAARPDAEKAQPAADASTRIESGVAFGAPRLAGATTARIVRAVTELAEAPTSPAASSGASRVGPARTMTLRLDQPDLGAVDIRMHLAGHELDLQLTVSDRQTLADLSRDRDALVSALGDRNYQLHSLVIQDAAGAPAAGSHPAASGDGGGGTRPETQGTGDQGRDRRNGHNETGRSLRGETRSDGGAPSRSPGARRGSLFV